MRNALEGYVRDITIGGGTVTKLLDRVRTEDLQNWSVSQCKEDNSHEGP